MLSNTCKYAIRAMVYLAIKDDKVNKIGIKQIAEDLRLPTPFLGKIMQVLAKHKLLLSTKGPHGGFRVGKDPYKINILEIVQIIDGLDNFESCLIGLSICQNEESKKELCPFHKGFEPMKNELFETFKCNTVGELAEKLKPYENVIYTKV